MLAVEVAEKFELRLLICKYGSFRSAHFHNVIHSYMSLVLRLKYYVGVAHRKKCVKERESGLERNGLVNSSYEQYISQ